MTRVGTTMSEANSRATATVDSWRTIVAGELNLVYFQSLPRDISGGNFQGLFLSDTRFRGSFSGRLRERENTKAFSRVSGARKAQDHDNINIIIEYM